MFERPRVRIKRPSCVKRLGRLRNPALLFQKKRAVAPASTPGPYGTGLALVTPRTAQEIPTLPQRPFAILQRPFKRSVFDFHADRTRVARVTQRTEELAPVHIAEAGDLRRVPAGPVLPTS